VPGSGGRRARAFAPGHVTGVFVPDTGARDPRARGSRGAGLVLDLGVVASATWTPGPRTRLDVRGDLSRPFPISEDVARRLLGSSAGTLRIELSHGLPVGEGFGTSAAGALATALAVSRVLGRTERRAIEVAHLADLFGGGGLGGVASILGGGLEVRLRAGIPPFGEIVHRRGRLRVVIGVVGPAVASPHVLGDRRQLARIRRAAAGIVPGRGEISVGQFATASERFTDRVGFASRTLRSTIDGLRRRGLPAAQAMFGQSFFAPAVDERAWRRGTDWLRAAGVPFLTLSTAARGAHRLGTRERPGPPPDRRWWSRRPPLGEKLFRGEGGLARAP
jgi:pantoate kinase